MLKIQSLSKKIGDFERGKSIWEIRVLANWEMRVNGETEIEGDNKNTKEIEEIGEMGSIVGAEFAQPPVKLVVGYALTSKKKKSFLQPKLIGLAR